MRFCAKVVFNYASSKVIKNRRFLFNYLLSVLTYLRLMNVLRSYYCSRHVGKVHILNYYDILSKSYVCVIFLLLSNILELSFE